MTNTTSTTIQAIISSDQDQDDYELALEDAIENCIQPWLQTHNVEDGDRVIVRYSGATWQRLYGSTTTPVEDAKDLALKFAVDGDFRLIFTFDSADQTLTIVRKSHDEPMGATHIIEKLELSTIE